MNPSDLTRFVGAAPTWLGTYQGNGGVTNPGNNTLIADTGAMAAGVYDIFFDGSSSGAEAAGLFYCEWRNAANSATNHASAIFVHPGQECHFSWKGINVSANQRFRVFVYVGFTCGIAASVMAIRRL